MPSPTSSLTNDKPPSPCNEHLQPKSQGRGRRLFPATPWQHPVFAGGPPTFWDVTWHGNVQHISADHSRWDYPGAANLSACAHYPEIRWQMQRLQSWQSVSPALAAQCSQCPRLPHPLCCIFWALFASQIFSPQSSLKWCFMFHLLLSGLWPSRTPSL